MVSRELRPVFPSLQLRESVDLKKRLKNRIPPCLTFSVAVMNGASLSPCGQVSSLSLSAFGVTSGNALRQESPSHRQIA